MKYIKKISESFGESEVIKAFDKALESGKSSVNLDAHKREFENFVKDKHLYDKYYLYKDSVFRLDTYETGGWYATDLINVGRAHVFQQKTFDRIKELEKAFNML